MPEEKAIEKPKEEPKKKALAQPKPQAKPTVSKLLKGKNWYSIVAPKFFNEKPLGDALAADSSLLIGRKVSASLMELTGDPSRYYMSMRFKISNIDGFMAQTVFDGHECTRDFAARIVQRRTQRIDTNDVLQLKDNKIRVKAIAITNRRVTEIVGKAVRKKLQEMIAAAAEDRTTEEFVKKFISGELQNQIKTEVGKLYPLRIFEIRKTEVL